MAALLAGEIDLMFDNLGVTLQHVKAGRLRALATCGEKRVASLPEVPAMSEILSGFSSVAWFGIVAPPKTPMPIAEKLSAAVAEAIRMPDVRERLAHLSAEPIGGTPAEMAAFMRRDEERWKIVIEAAQVKVD
jgi:tripartite-type tricarboxylate transporter receptor subunit TctC